ncbi:MAG: hypothetical protein H7839_14035 [Magnetococcus sp. YQC-5]
MMMGLGDRDKKQLLAVWRQLSSEDRRNVLNFAQFLASRQDQEKPTAPTVPDTPLPIPRPPVETAVAGLKRMKKTYPMIEADEGVLAEASRILMGKVMGISDADIVNQLETFFAERYRIWSSSRHSGIT